MAAYLVGNFKVTNVDGFTEYRNLVGKTIADHGGEYVVAAAKSVPMEGEPAHLSVVLKFPDMDALKGWYDSPEYQEILPLRLDNSEGIVTFAED